jgi:hypothetical protein
MKCPHCNTGVHEGFSNTVIVDFAAVLENSSIVSSACRWVCKHQRCPECNEGILVLMKVVNGTRVTETFTAYPQSAARPVPSEVVDPYRSDFVEACKVLPFSAKASAALSRRCLQAILREKAKTKSKDLFDQIEEVSAPRILPSHIVEDLHAVRNIGNFAAHPMKSTNTGEIIEVEDGEAEWNLDVLESLFDFYFVQPALSAKRKAELNKKLKEAGKPEIK